MDGSATDGSTAGSTGALRGVVAAVVTVSDRAAAGEYADRSGPLAATLLGDAGASVADVVVVPDEIPAITSAVTAAIAGGARLVVTTGGTGVAARDVTPEATESLLERPIPGIAEAIRAAGRAHTPMADLSRGVAGLVGGALVANLAGSPGAVADGIAVVAAVARHVLEQVDGLDH